MILNFGKFGLGSMNELNIGTRQKGVTTAEVVTYIIIVLVLAAVGLGMYVNSSIEKSVSEALALGEAQKGIIEEYFNTHGEMPQSGADAGLEGFAPAGVLKELTWQPGALREADSDPLLTGTLNGLVDLSEFGERFEEFESGYLLIARAQDDGTIIWDCMADSGSTNAMPGRYLPETCERVSADDEESEEAE